MTGSWWLDEPAPPLRRRALDRPAEVEIVGAGVTGCSCALTLARAGVRVRVHDAREVAGGASGRNGGFALRGSAMRYVDAREQLGVERARALWRATEDALNRLAELAGDAFRPVGGLRLAGDEGERAELRGDFEALRADGFAVEWRKPLEPPLGELFTAAVFDPTDGALHPARWIRRLAAHAVDAGAEIRVGSRIDERAQLEAERVVIATDGYPTPLAGALDAAIAPTRGQMVVTEPLPQRLFGCPHYARRGFAYWQQLDDGRIAIGGFRDLDVEREYTTEEATTEPIQRALEDLLASLAGARVRIDARWAGIFGRVADLLPIVGPVSDDESTWVARGYSGHGNVLGLLCGELVANALLGERDPLLELFDPRRLSD